MLGRHRMTQVEKQELHKGPPRVWCSDPLQLGGEEQGER